MILNSSSGIAILLGFGLLMYAITWYFSRKDKITKSLFLVADRKVGSWVASFSIASTWIWAPALFISAKIAYTKGIVGFLWFFVPNVACLIIFGYFAVILRNRYPQGFTFPGYVRQNFSDRVHNLYLFQFFILQTCSFAVQLLAGAKVINWMTGLPFVSLTIALAAIALLYSLFSGLKASIVTDFVQMSFILVIGFILIPIAVARSGGMSTVLAGIGGQTGQYTNLFNGVGIQVMLSFGLINTIGLLSGPFGDQTFWQRTFAIRKDSIFISYVKGAFIFALVPAIFSLTGFIGVSVVPDLAAIDTGNVNIITISKLLPLSAVVLFAVMLLSGLASTLDSNLCAVSSLTSVDVMERIYNKSLENHRLLNISRISMVVLCVFGVLIANIPGLQILHLFLFYGTLRATTLLPTVISILASKIDESSIFYGLLVSLAIGVPVFVVGKLTNNIAMALSGSLLAVGLSGIITLIGSFIINLNLTDKDCYSK